MAAKKKKAPQTVRISVPTDSIRVPDVEPAERLTKAQQEAWTLWAREVVNGENVEAEVSPEVLVAFLQWSKLMNDRGFCLLPMNAAEFRTSLAGRLPPNDRRRIVELAGLSMAEAMATPFTEVVNLARRNVLAAQGRGSNAPLTSDSVQTAPLTWSDYRTPQEWRTLRARVGLPASESTWRNLRKDHPCDIQGEPGREKHMVRLSQKLVTAWGLKLPEFDQ